MWLIQTDETDQAIILLRRALDQEPRNAEVITTMAEAHLRNGERALAGEMLALSVEASNKGITQTLDYARFLVGDKTVHSPHRTCCSTRSNSTTTTWNC